MTINQGLQKATQKLQKSGITSAHLDTELLLSFILKRPREYVLTHPDFELNKNQVLKFNKLINQRAKNIPLAYLTGVKEFYGRPFYVDKKILVPRPETELLVDETKRVLRNPTPRYRGIGFQDEHTVIIDIGTGSGCIIITLAKELENKKNIKFLATDISEDVLVVARKNARLRGVADKIKFLRGNLLEPILKNRALVACNLLLVANLPYLTPIQIKNSPTIKHEPRLALAAGADGLKYYRQLGAQLQQFNIQYSNIPISLFCEIDPKQSKAIKTIFSLAKSIALKKDLAGRNRLFIARF